MWYYIGDIMTCLWLGPLVGVSVCMKRDLICTPLLFREYRCSPSNISILRILLLIN